METWVQTLTKRQMVPSHTPLVLQLHSAILLRPPLPPALPLPAPSVVPIPIPIPIPTPIPFTLSVPRSLLRTPAPAPSSARLPPDLPTVPSVIVRSDGARTATAAGADAGAAAGLVARAVILPAPGLAVDDGGGLVGAALRVGVWGLVGRARLAVHGWLWGGELWSSRYYGAIGMLPRAADFVRGGLGRRRVGWKGGRCLALRSGERE